MSTLRVVKIIKRESKICLVVSDGEEQKRAGKEAHDKFHNSAKEFIQEKYGKNSKITHSQIITIEESGSIWIELESHDANFANRIAEDYRLYIETMK